jgi:hypothetical protein
MKTKNIFKTLAFAMLMPAMMLTTACSSDDSIINTPEKTENTTGKVYEIPITINATRQGDDATTRAKYTYDSDTGLGQLSFTTGDQLFVSGEHQLAGNFSGTLNWDGGTVFIGTIRTTNGYSGTAIELLNSADFCEAFLLPEGYTNYNYFTISKVNPDDPNSIESVTKDVTEAFITSKTTAIEQFSEEWASWKSYNDEQGFALAPENAILNFTITGLTPNSTSTTVSFHYPQAGNLNWSINKTVQTDNTGTATFAIGLSLWKYVFTNLKNFSLSVDGKYITLVTEDKTLSRGHIYNITRSVAPAYPLLSAATASDYGKVVCADGHLHDAKTAVPAGCTAVGILGKVTGTGHGLILALEDATPPQWTAINSWTSVTIAGTTLKVLPDDDARGAKLTSYTTLGETTVSNWAVAQKSDYEAIFTNLGSKKSASRGRTYDGNVNAYITTGVGGTAISGWYWSASTVSIWNTDAWYFYSDDWDKTFNHDFTNSVRPVLGF